MAMAPRSKATYTIELTDEKGMGKFSGNTNWVGETHCNLIHVCNTMINSAVVGADKVADEFIHAAGGVDKGVAAQAGVSPACYGSHDSPAFIAGGCNELRQKIREEVQSAEDKKSPPEKP